MVRLDVAINEVSRSGFRCVERATPSWCIPAVVKEGFGLLEISLVHPGAIK